MNDPKSRSIHDKYSTASLLSYNKVLQGLTNRWQYYCQLQSEIAKTHELTAIELQAPKTDSKIQPYKNIRWADLDPVDNKYLLVANNFYKNSCIGIFDCEKANVERKIPQIAHVMMPCDRESFSENQINCLQWYPRDAGLFSSSYFRQNRVQIWDPNVLQVVEEFTLDSSVNHHHMSLVASNHSLVAAALKAGYISLCDLRIGSSIHSLIGHKGPANMVQWSVYHPNTLASGGEDKTIRLWDVRSGKSCLKVLINGDNFDSHRRESGKKRIKKRIHQEAITSLCFSFDGMSLLSHSADGVLNVWDSVTGKNRNLKFRHCYKYKFPFRMGITHNLYPDLIFVPAKLKVLVFDILRGTLVNVLNCCHSAVVGAIYNPRSMDLYTYGGGVSFLVWSPELLTPKIQTESGTLNKLLTADSWSSDED